MTGKYEPLDIFLRGLSQDQQRISLSFRRIKEIIGTPLPKSATDHRAWWSNQVDANNRSQANAWLAAGFSVSSVQQGRGVGSVEFRRSRAVALSR